MPEPYSQGVLVPIRGVVGRAVERSIDIETRSEVIEKFAVLVFLFPHLV